MTRTFRFVAVVVVVCGFLVGVLPTDSNAQAQCDFCYTCQGIPPWRFCIPGASAGKKCCKDIPQPCQTWGLACP